MVTPLNLNLIDKIFGMESSKKPFAENQKAGGGAIFGPGTATSDSIPAMLSDGEYVVRAASVKRLGLPALEYMNKNGQLPGFAYGGAVSAISDEFTGFTKYLEDKRMGLVNKIEPNNLMSALNIMAQTGLAGTEMLTRLVGSPFELGSMVEKAAGFAGQHGFGAVKDASVYAGKQLAGFQGLSKDQIAALMEDAKTGLVSSVSKGGLGLSMGMISSLRGGVGAKQVAKVTDDLLTGFAGIVGQ